MTGNSTHLVYRISSLEDVINPLSPEGCELASDGLTDYLDLVRPSVPIDVPMILEITGWELDDPQKNAVVRGLSAHYLNRLDEINDIIRRCWVKTFWFALCLAISSALIFLNNSTLNEVLVQYLYIPFWFFGYRVVTFPLLDLRPVKREQRRLKHFMGMKVVFTKRQADESLSDYADDSAEVFTLDFATLETYRVMNGTRLSVDCVVCGMDDLLNSASTPGRELMSSSMAGYLEQIEHFVSAGTSVRLTIKGARFSQQQQETIGCAIRHYYQLCDAGIRQATNVLLRKVVIFVAGVVVSSVILFCVGNVVDVAFHELLIIVLWFFADYLIEFVVLENMILRRQRHTYERLRDLTLAFEPSAGDSTL